MLMFLGRGSTRFALNPTKAKEDPVKLEDTRCSLIGNSFHAGVFAMILSEVFYNKRQLTERPSAQEVVDRQGLYPGEVFVPGLRCDLSRPPSYHRLDGQRRGCAILVLRRRGQLAQSVASLSLSALRLTPCYGVRITGGQTFGWIPVNS